MHKNLPPPSVAFVAPRTTPRQSDFAPPVLVALSFNLFFLFFRSQLFEGFLSDIGYRISDIGGLRPVHRIGNRSSFRLIRAAQLFILLRYLSSDIRAGNMSFNVDQSSYVTVRPWSDPITPTPMVMIGRFCIDRTAFFFSRTPRLRSRGNFWGQFFFRFRGDSGSRERATLCSFFLAIFFQIFSRCFNLFFFHGVKNPQ